MDIWHSDTHTGSSSDPFEYPQIISVAKLDGYTHGRWENPLNYSRPWAPSAALTLRMSEKSADLVSVNTGTRQTSYIQQYCSFTKPLGTAILTVVSFVSTDIKLSIDCRSCHRHVPWYKLTQFFGYSNVGLPVLRHGKLYQWYQWYSGHRSTYPYPGHRST